MSPAPRRARHLRRVATAWLLVVGLTGVLGVVAQAQAAARDHACCPRPPVAAAAPEAPCPSLLPLACCDATVLPAGAPPPPEHRDGLAVPLADAASLAARGAPAAHTAPDPVPRVSPLRLSVVLRL